MASGYVASFAAPESRPDRRRGSQVPAVVADASAEMSRSYDACARDLICEMFTGSKWKQRTYEAHGLNTSDHGRAVRRKIEAIHVATQKAMKVAAEFPRRQIADTPAAAAGAAGGMETDLSAKERASKDQILTALKDTPRVAVSTASHCMRRTHALSNSATCV